MRNTAIVLAVLAVVALAVPVQGGATWKHVNDDWGKWEVASNWNEPPDGTSALVGKNLGGLGRKMVEFDDDTGTKTSTYLAVGYLDYDHTINQSGGTLTLTSDRLPLLLGYEGGGTYSHSGGTLNTTDGPARLGTLYNEQTFTCTGIYNLSSAGVWNAADIGVAQKRRSTGGTVEGALNISGGTIDAANVEIGPDGNGTLKVTGKWEDTTNNISFDSYTQYGTGTLHCEIAGNPGIETIVVSGTAIFAGTLDVDAIGTGHSGTYTLMTYTSRTDAFAGFTKPAGWNDPVYDVDMGGGVLGLQITVPEPATLALLGIGGIGVLVRRKRK